MRILLFLLLLAGGGAQVAAQGDATNWEAIARTMVERMALTRGERVLLVGVPGANDAVVAPLRAAVRRAGGEDLGVVAVRGTPPGSWETPFTRSLARKREGELDRLLAGIDVGVMLPGTQPPDTVYAALQRVIGRPDAGRRRTVHFHWAGAFALDGRMIDISPSHARTYQRAILETDYAALSRRQRAFERALRQGEVRVTTPAGTDLRFRAGDRPVTRQDGDASAARAAQGRNLIDREVEFPAGAIRVAPLEESVEGTIAFPDGAWNGEPVRGLVMRFAHGRVTGFEARAGRAAVEAELAGAGEAGRAFREFALGFNALLAVPERGERWIPFYGYGAGAVRLSSGNNRELGGTVGGDYVRSNFFADATVTVGGEAWVRGGRLVR